MNARLLVSCLAAHLFWFVLFSDSTRGMVNFWTGITAASGILGAIALFNQRRYFPFLFAFKKEHFAVGLISAVALYAVFYAGHAASTALLPFAPEQISRVYAPRASAPALVLGILLTAWIGPAEEIFWRGYLQQRLGALFGPGKGYIIAAIVYASVHVYALNLMLFLAALSCGLFWGALFRRYGSLWPVIISHSLWDLLVFVVFPFKG